MTSSHLWNGVRYADLAGAHVLLSGGASGIGEAMVRAFAAQGAAVSFVDRDAARGERLAAELGAGCRFVAVDVTDLGAYRDAIGRLQRQAGPVRCLVNNAADDSRHDWRRVEPDEWEARMAVNLRHAFFAIQAVAPGMIEAGGGSIINLGSISWMVLSPGLPVYETAKAAMHGLTRAMARELGPHGVRVNALVPGWVMTERQVALWLNPETEAWLERNQPLRGRVMPEDVAAMALFLASDQSRMASGQAFLIDGGWAHG